ncbi:hypothetical protein SPBRAN_1304 [uncultured Candidatus Thioglobus sp.]|nr:hypothetical protein SPBRAN_1304 [uncultured Candidatus Thioglobus sp.]
MAGELPPPPPRKIERVKSPMEQDLTLEMFSENAKNSDGRVTSAAH